MPLRKETYERDEDGYWPDPDDAEIVEVVDISRGRLTLLERVEEKPTPEPDYPTNEEGEPLCVGKDDGQCGNTVDEPGGTCWHHSDED